MASDNQVTIVGNLTDDPELRYTPNGAAVAKSLVGRLVEDIPNLRWADVGDLSTARITESLTALLISVNREYRIRNSGLRLTGRNVWGAPER